MVRRSVAIALAIFLGTLAHGADKQTEVPTTNYNLRINPLSLLFGVINADFDFKVGKRFTLGPSLAFATSSNGTTKATAFGVGARGNLYLSGDAISDSWYLGPVAGLYFFSVKNGASSGTTTAFNIGAVAGYNWVWASGFNMMLGGGAQYFSLGSTVKASDGTVLITPGLSGILPMLDFTLGYTF